MLPKLGHYNFLTEYFFNLFLKVLRSNTLEQLEFKLKKKGFTKGKMRKGYLLKIINLRSGTVRKKNGCYHCTKMIQSMAYVMKHQAHFIHLGLTIGTFSMTLVQEMNQFRVWQPINFPSVFQVGLSH